MHRPAKPANLRRTRKAWAFLGLSALGLSTALAVAGCSMTHGAAKDEVGDPLLGPTPDKDAQPVPRASAPEGGLPPIPPSAGFSTTAALATQAPTSKSLAIPNAPGGGWQRVIPNTPPGVAPEGAAAKSATVSGAPKAIPVPKDTGFTGTPPAPIQPTGWSASDAAPTAPNAEPPLDPLLKARNVIGQKEEAVPGGVHLVCIVRTGATTTQQVYETTAADHAAAVQAIVQKIDQQR